MEAVDCPFEKRRPRAGAETGAGVGVYWTEAIMSAVYSEGYPMRRNRGKTVSFPAVAFLLRIWRGVVGKRRKRISK